jgi:serine protease Do
MHTQLKRLNNRITRTVAATGAAALLVSGAAWHSLAATEPAAVEPQTATVVAQQPSSHAPAVMGDRESFADIVQVVSPAVVNIEVRAQARVSPTAMQEDDLFRRFFGDPFGGDSRGRRMPPPARRGIGSGVVVSADGYILTNHHVVGEADAITVEFTDGRRETATLVGSDAPTDLAVIKIDGKNLPFLKLGDSDAVRVGDVVLAVGNPLNIGQTVTMGIVSAKGRSTGIGDGSYEDFLQTDAPINQGNSGGALVSTKGELIGINSQILSPSGGNIGIGFAIPANMARHVMDDLRTDGRVRRGRLGVGIQSVTSDLAASLGLSDVRGAIVNSVEPGSAAANAGVAVGDVITKYNGQEVRDSAWLRNRVAETEPSSAASLVVVRDGKERTISVTLDELEPERSARAGGPAGAEGRDALGVSVAPLTPELAASAGLPRNAQGLLVQDVAPGSRAAEAGIRPGDVITEANNESVQSVDDLRAAVSSRDDRPVLLLVSREGRSVFVPVPRG